MMAVPAFALDGAGGGALMGWVEDNEGVPVAGAVISLFGRGVGRSGLVTFSDSAGRFFVPSLPAGSYTLRALGRGLRPAPARQVTILPNQSSIFAVSLSPLGELSDREAVERGRELTWLLRHKTRSVLEQREPVRVAATSAPPAPGAVDLLGRVGPLFSSLGGTLELMANPAALGVGTPVLTEDDGALARFGVIRLGGRLAESGRWSLGGFVSESGSAAWRTAGEFSFHPGGGHEITAGAGYGSPMLRPSSLSTRDSHLENRGVGAICLQDRWDVGSVTATLGARYAYVGFLRRQNHLDPSATLELHQQDGSTLRGTFAMRTLVPGGDLLTLSTLSSGPAIAFAVMDNGLRPERLARYEFAVDQPVGSSTLSAHTFYESAQDPLINAFQGPASSGSLHIFNHGHSLASRGVGLSLGRRFGSGVKGSVTYTYGRSWRETPVAGATDTVYLSFRQGIFHDFVTRLETVIDRSDTRLVAFYRINTLSPDSENLPGVSGTRFDVQLRQGLPFLGDLTRADWELLLAYRNLFYEASEGATLDELTVANPPKRILGGVSVRF